MKIESLKLHKYKRTPMYPTDTLEVEFIGRSILISGCNGAGKTSLLSELSPLPSDRNDFERGGYKEIVITHRGVEYVIKSDFTNTTPKYSFLMDGEEQNTAGLVTMQRDLAQQHFSINQTVHELLTGKETFTSLSLVARKKLFSSITNLNIDEVLRGYAKLKDQEKTYNLLLKTQTANFKAEESKLIPKDQIDARRSELKTITERIDSLLSVREELVSYRHKEASESSYEELKKVSEMIKNFYKTNFNIVTSYPSKDLPKIKSKVGVDLALLTSRLDREYSILEEKTKELRLLEGSSNKSISELKEYKVTLENFISNIERGLEKEHLSYQNSIDEVTDKTSTDYFKLETAVPSIVVDLEVNLQEDNTLKYSTPKYNSLLEEKKTLLEELHRLTAIEHTLNEKLNQASNIDGNVECPNCKHNFSMSDALKVQIHKKEEMSSILKDKMSVQDKLKVVEESIEKTNTYFGLYRQLSNLRNNTPTLTKFWEVVDDNDLIKANPNGLEALVRNLSVELSSISDLKKAKAELEETNKSIEELSRLEQDSLETIKSDVESLNYLCTNLQEQKISLTEELSLIEKLESTYLKLQTLESKLSEAKESVRNYNRTQLVNSYLEIIDSSIRDYRLTSVQIETELSQINSIQYTLDKYEKDIHETQEHLKVLKAMLTELCPRTGLIARSISSFLNMIIHNVNNTISKIWSYKMVINPIDVGESELNYRFSVEVEDKLKVADISTVSSGMKQGIDLAFKLVLYKLLKLENYPLMLDELGNAMDSTHMSTLVHLISSLANSDTFSQIFIITHKENFNFIRDLQEVPLN